MSPAEASEKSRRQRRRRLARGLTLGAAAVGIPALVNLLIARSARRLEREVWGRPGRYAWRYGEVSFQKMGSGAPVLLLHSLGPGHDGTEWREVAEFLAESHCVFVPDLLGWGSSERRRMAYDDTLYIRLVADFLADVVRGPAAIIAAGQSAPYALQAALDDPRRVDALGLVHPSGLDTEIDEPDLRDALLRKALQAPVFGTAALNLYTSRQGIRQHLEKDVFLSPQDVGDGEVERFYASAHQPGAHYALASYLAGFLNHRVADLDRLEQPVWLAWGRGAGHAEVRRQLESWLEQIPAAEIEVFDGVGSMPHFETPAGFGERLLRFLTQTTVSAG